MKKQTVFFSVSHHGFCDFHDIIFFVTCNQIVHEDYLSGRFNNSLLLAIFQHITCEWPVGRNPNRYSVKGWDNIFVTCTPLSSHP